VCVRACVCVCVCVCVREKVRKCRALVEMDEINDLMSSCVGQLFWHGASAHLRHREASRRAPRSDSVLCLMSEKSCSKEHGWGEGEREGGEERECVCVCGRERESVCVCE
jgi:hypothetical protein